MSAAGFRQLQQLLHKESGFVLEPDKRYLLDDRLKTLLRESNLANLDELAQRLRQKTDPDLPRRVAEAVTINETSFFRDHTFFKVLSEKLLPSLIASRRERRRLRFWCAGCSTGQEPYSIAMLIEDRIRELAGWRIEILATDLSSAVLQAAMKGRYSQFEVQRGLPVTMLLRHFNRDGELWAVNESLRARVTFQRQNLLAPLPEGAPFDAIFCRNVLFYFDAQTRRTISTRMVRRLEPDGFLTLGATERIADGVAGLVPDETAPFIFRPAASKI